MSDQNNDDNPWSNPGHSKQDNPDKKRSEKEDNNIWTKKRQKQASEENFFEQINNQFKKFKDPGGSNNTPPIGPSPFKLFAIGAFAAAAIWLGSGFYRVQEGELAVVLRFGKLARISNAGLQYRLPYPFEREIVKRVDVLNKIDSQIKSSSDSKEDAEQNLILTGDENVVHTNYTVLWKIRDITEYLFTSNDPESTIVVAAESAIREVLGQTTARLALTEGRGTIGTKAQELLQKILDSYKLGVQIVSVQLQRVEPPSQVIKAFNDMQASLVDADRLKNEAESYANEKLPNARAAAQKNIQEAEGYKQKTILLAKGEVARFTQVLKAYQINPDLTKKRYFLETIQKILSAIDQKTILDGKIAPGVMPYLNLKPSVVAPQKDAKK